MGPRNSLHESPVGYDPATGTYQAHHEWTDPEPVGYTVLTTVATLTGHEPHELPPLTDVVDTDALDSVFEGRQYSEGRTDRVTYSFAGCEVTIYRDGRIAARPPGHD